MKILKTILQSKATYLILLFLALTICIINTKIIKNYSIFNDEEKDFIGIITNYKIDGNKLSMTIKTNKKEKLQSFYYINSEEEKELLQNKIK